MTEVFALSAYETSAEQFFRTLIARHADLVLDVRLRNSGQLCGFTKAADLAYFVPALTRAAYVSDPLFAPAPALLADYLAKKIDWNGYARGYGALIAERGAAQHFRTAYGRYSAVCLLGTATKARRSHAEALCGLLEAEQE